MSEAPKRIWADGNQEWGFYKWCIDDVEYIRADLVEAAIKRALEAAAGKADLKLKSRNCYTEAQAVSDAIRALDPAQFIEEKKP